MSVETRKKDLPPFTLKNVAKDIVDGIQFLIYDPKANAFSMPLLLLFESIAVKYIRANVPYTEIDYTAYVEQIHIINSGEYDYDKIYGGTGPLVYPAGHVWIFQMMTWLTDGTNNITLGQEIFGYLYLLTILLVFILCYKLRVKPWCVALLVFSKRLHSIYMLRLFNDCFTTLFSVISCMLLVGNNSLLASAVLSLAISIKMNALLFVPGLLCVVFQTTSYLTTILSVVLMGLVQVALSWKFLNKGDVIRDHYFHGAFEFGRKFMYKWTVNWKFLPQDVFLSDIFHKALLAGQLCTLLWFLLTRYLEKPILSYFTQEKVKLSGNKIAYIMVTSNFIGVIFSRSLHYQFLSWYCWTLPILLHYSSISPFLGVPWWFLHEYCWNVYPATPQSSQILLACNVFLLATVWLRKRI